MLKILFSVFLSIISILLIHYGYTYLKNNYFDQYEYSEEDISEEELNDDLLLDDSDDDVSDTELVIEDSEKAEMENNLTDILNTNINENN